MVEKVTKSRDERQQKQIFLTLNQYGSGRRRSHSIGFVKIVFLSEFMHNQLLYYYYQSHAITLFFCIKTHLELSFFDTETAKVNQIIARVHTFFCNCYCFFFSPFFEVRFIQIDWKSKFLLFTSKRQTKKKHSERPNERMNEWNKINRRARMSFCAYSVNNARSNCFCWLEIKIFFYYTRTIGWLLLLWICLYSRRARAFAVGRRQIQRSVRGLCVHCAPTPACKAIAHTFFVSFRLSVFSSFSRTPHHTCACSAEKRCYGARALCIVYSVYLRALARPIRFPIVAFQFSQTLCGCFSFAYSL